MCIVYGLNYLDSKPPIQLKYKFRGLHAIAAAMLITLAAP